VTVDLSAYRQHIEGALAYAGGTHTYDDIREGVEQGRFQFWPGVHSAAVTEIIEYPRCRALNIILAGGDVGYLAEMEAGLPVILDWARAQGCTSATFSGRKGWERTFLTRTGWVPSLVVFEKKLDG
jgi:hypothetical protein